MDDFRMELDSIETPCLISHRRGGRQFRMSDQSKTGRHIGDRIAVLVYAVDTLSRTIDFVPAPELPEE